MPSILHPSKILERENDSWTTKIAFMNSKDVDFVKLYGKKIKDD